MPELPEVEVICRSLRIHLVGKYILYSIIRNGNLRWPVHDVIYALNNELILSIKRRAKYLLIKLSNLSWIIIHLGMSGSLRILPKDSIPENHDHIDLVISNNIILRYTDPRRFGAWLWTKRLKEHSLIKFLGPEPLNSLFNANYLKSRCIKKKVIIKHYLMNTKLVVGIGNIYASESLFVAKINPNRLALTLSQMECIALVKAIKKILQLSIKSGGTTIKNFLQVNGESGYFTEQLQVYGRKGRPCFICSTPIITCRHAGRTTFYCHKCQK